MENSSLADDFRGVTYYVRPVVVGQNREFVPIQHVWLIDGVVRINRHVVVTESIPVLHHVYGIAPMQHVLASPQLHFFDDAVSAQARSHTCIAHDIQSVFLRIHDARMPPPGHNGRFLPEVSRFAELTVVIFDEVPNYAVCTLARPSHIHIEILPDSRLGIYPDLVVEEIDVFPVGFNEQ